MSLVCMVSWTIDYSVHVWHVSLVIIQGEILQVCDIVMIVTCYHNYSPPD